MFCTMCNKFSKYINLNVKFGCHKPRKYNASRTQVVTYSITNVFTRH